MNIILKPFQIQAVAELKEIFLTLWQKPSLGNKIVFQSPTGSGKTLMLAEFLRDMTGDPRFTNSDVAYIWITINDDLAMQSKNKLWNYYDGAGEISLFTAADVKDGKLLQNGVFFVNWQKLVQSRANMRPLVLRTEGENNTTFDQYIENTRNEKREIILIIDEEHYSSNTVLSNDLINNIIKPRIIIGVSATPQGTGAKVEVKRQDVILSGLIKEKTVFQTADDLHHTTETDQDKILLELAFNKRQELINLQNRGIQKNKINSGSIFFNPLVLIQLPNEESVNRELNTTSKLDIVKMFLKEKGVGDDEIAVWLSTNKENLENIEKNDSSVSFLLFKQAAATGWDCPRAAILLMFREIQNPVFAIQTVGRILRMPFGVHFSIPELNRGYLYTNYTRNKVLASYSANNATGQNRPVIFHSFRKGNIEAIELESTTISRTDYNSLLSSFQDTFKDIADKYFEITDEDIFGNGLKKLSEKGFDTATTLTNNLIIDVEIEDYDNFVFELKSCGGDKEYEMSQNDVERLYDLLCFQILAKQSDESKKYAPEKSYGRLKTALNVWFSYFYQNRFDWYRVIVKDLLKVKSGNSILSKVIDESLSVYRPVQELEVGKREENKKKTVIIDVPPVEQSFTDLFEVIDVKKSAMMPFYIEKNYSGKQNEIDFISFLENNKNVLWWHKNGDSGIDFFAIPYFDRIMQKERLFYPDWFIKTSDKLWIIDTKSGFTVESAINNGKAEALKNYLSDKPNFAGGIVERQADIWKIYSSDIQKKIQNKTDNSENSEICFEKVNLEF